MDAHCVMTYGYDIRKKHVCDVIASEKHFWQLRTTLKLKMWYLEVQFIISQAKRHLVDGISITAAGLDDAVW